jgi:hypothetical protein
MEPIEFSPRGICTTLDSEEREQLPSFLQRNVFIISAGTAIAMCRMHFVSRPEDAAARSLRGVKVVGRPRSKHSDTHWKALGLKVRKKGIVQKGKTHFG